MIIGEIVETLIFLRDHNSLSRSEDEAVCAACNILSKIPNTTDEDDAKRWLDWMEGHME